MSVLPLDGCLLPYPASSDCRWLVFLAAGCTVVNSLGGSCCLHVDKYDGATGRSMFFLLCLVICIMPAACFLRPRATCFRLPACCFGFVRFVMRVCGFAREEPDAFSRFLWCGLR